MRAKIDIVGRRTIFSNDDLLTAEIIVKRNCDEPYFTDLVSEVKLSLACEGNFIIGSGDSGVSKAVTYFQSKPIIARCNYTTRGHVIYSGQLQFPSIDDDLPSSLSYDGSKKNSIKWLLKAEVHRRDNNDPLCVERSCMFRHASPLPTLLNLVDVVHTELVQSSDVTLVTTHAAAGLPQVPLSAGIGVSVESDGSGKFTITRLRVLLHEINIVKIGDQQEQLPVRRWLLEDYHPRHRGILLDNKHTNLNYWIGDIHVDHATLAPTLQLPELSHSFNLVVDATISWTQGPHQTLTKKVSSVSPIIVLPRMDGTQYSSGISSPGAADVPAHVLFDPAEITDTTDDEFDHDELDVSTSKETDEQVSTMSSDSAQSILSDRLKLDTDGIDKMLTPIITTSSLCDV